MNKKMIGIFVVMLTISSAMTTILFSDNGTVNASNAVNLDFNYVWLRVQSFANVIHDVNWLEHGENGIPKGRSWATAGENYTRDNILWPNIGIPNNPCGLTGYTNLSIGYVDDDRGKVPGTKNVAKQYSTKIVIHDYNLTLINPDEPDQYIPYTESFPFGLGFLPHDHLLSPYFDIYHRTHFNDSEIPIRFRSLNCEPCPLSNPYAGASPEYYFNIDVTALNDFPAILGGIVEYVEDGQSIPEDQNDTVFLMNESISCETKIQNITENATGCILIHDQNRNYNFGNADDQNCSFAWVNWTDTNMSLLLNDLKNGSKYFALLDTETQTLNFFNCSCIIEEKTPWVGVYDLRNKSDPDGSGQSTVINHNLLALVYSWLHRDDPCKAIIVAGPLDTHWMLHTVNGWSWFNFKNIFDAPYMDCYWVPMFSVNASVSEWIFDNIQTASISGFLDQDIYEQTHNKPGVISHNVVAYRNISHSPDDKIVVLSNRVDGWFSETPGDSGVGGAILLGIAKYLKDNDITPKYNLTFLFTTGEEYGMRGAQHFIDTHPSGTDEGEYNYIHWIGFDQLGFNLTGDGNKLQTEIKTQNESRPVIRAIANDTDYKNRTNNFYDFCVNYSSGGGAEDFVWKNNCLNTILFEKGRGWNGWHNTGNNYAEGDSLNYIDRNDVNVTFELAWNITKYFCVNPDCEFDDEVSYTTFDSPNDGDTLSDSIRAESSINSILPSDKVMVKATLHDQNDNGAVVAWKVTNYTITTLSQSHPYNITITIPDTDAQGEYTL
ncbi:MAG TPA: Zn-dependent exopeptidase M28 [Thermoplasmata archaeon]|nr:Zn-dependent exopeptidase M28 [Thermoplasmata archaeon]